mgnify:CR=1 FL=1
MNLKPKRRQHRYPLNSTVTRADKIVHAAQELHRTQAQKKHKMSCREMQALRDLSKIFLDAVQLSDNDNYSFDFGQFCLTLREQQNK